MNRPSASKSRSLETIGRSRRKHRLAFRDAFARLRERPMAHGFALALLTMAMLSLLLLKMAADRIDHLGSPLDGARTLNLFLLPEIDEARARALAAEFSADARVAEVEAISPAQGLRELAHVDGSGEALSALAENPLPWVLAIEPRAGEDGEVLMAAFGDRPEVDHVADESGWRRRADAVMAAARAAGLALAGLIALATVLIVANAVRTIRVEGAPERSLQRVFGATEADLRRPYVYLGLLYGAIAGAVASLLALAIALALRPTFAPLAELFNLAPAQSAAGGWWWLAVVPASAALGAFGAWLGCRFESDVEATE